MNEQTAIPPLGDEKGEPDHHESRQTTPEHVKEVNAVLTAHEPQPDEQNIRLGWRSWLVVFVTCFGIMAQVFVVTAAGSVIAFIERDLGDPGLSGWVIQGPLLMQSVLSPIVGRLSDVLDRRYLSSMPPLIAFIGAVVSAKASSMSILIGGGILIGVTLSTISIIQAIPAEILPLKYRALANGFAFLGGAIGGLVGSLGAGGVTNQNASGWRNIFWMQAAFHLATSLGLILFYHPPRRSDYPKLKLRKFVWSMDPIGSLLFISSTTLMLLALDWAAGTYPWHDVHVAVPLGTGCGLLLAFAIYEWKGRSDGIVAHVFFQGSPNFALSVFAFAVEGWIFYSAVNSITPQIVLNLGWESTSWRISIRQLSYQVTTIFASIVITLYSTYTKDLKRPLLLTYTLFLVVAICYATVSPSESRAQYGFNVLSAIGQAGPLTLLVALVQFTAPHAYLSTATGLAFSARAVGGAFGSAVLNAIINGTLGRTLTAQVGGAAVGAGLPRDSVPALLEALANGGGGGGASMAALSVERVPGATADVWAVALEQRAETYAHAYRLAWASVAPFVVLALGAVAGLRGVKEKMTGRVEASVERRGWEHEESGETGAGGENVGGRERKGEEDEKI